MVHFITFLYFMDVLVAVFWLSIVLAWINRQNILMFLICIELALLSLSINFLCCSAILEDMLGMIYALFILTIAAAESAIGLSLIVLQHNLRGSVSCKNKQITKA